MTANIQQITWREVFDSYKLMNAQNIETVNSFLYERTVYDYFAFNGNIYKVMNPKQFSMGESDTKLKVIDYLE